MFPETSFIGGLHRQIYSKIAVRLKIIAVYKLVVGSDITVAGYAC